MTVERAREALAAQPFSALLGARLLAFSASGVTLALDARADLRQQDGWPGILTSSLTVDYLRPARGDLTAHAWVLHAGRSRALSHCELTTVSASGEDVVCALAQGSAVRRRNADDRGRLAATPAETS